MPFFNRRFSLKLTDKQRQIIHDLGYDNAQEFLKHYPFRYEFLFEKDIETWEKGDTVVIHGQLVSSFSTFRFGKNRSRTSFKVMYQKEVISVTMFNMPFLRDSNYSNGIVVVGVVQENGSLVSKKVTNQPLDKVVGIDPVYPTKAHIKQHEIKRLIKKILKNETVENIVPEKFITEYRLLSRKKALSMIHFPKSQSEIALAARTLKYEEFLLYHVANALNAEDRSKGKAIKISNTLINSVINELPFKLTEDQMKSLTEILNDLGSNQRMNRLLQGDVGSGKTIVALLSAIPMIEAGYQVAFMVPTEILMEQHLHSIKNLFPKLSVRALSSSISGKKETISEDLVIGTHALFQEDVKFSRLGMVIIDEQHRFGVNQRKALINKGELVDVLMLTATPIPRSLAASLYFDLDVSTIASYPSYRKQTKTYFIKENSIRSILDDLHNINDQMYVVCPSIEPDDRRGVRDVYSIYKQFVKLFPDKVVAVLHGKMKTEEKESIMHNFAIGKIDILVSTTIIEVGIDVHTANTMIIYNAEMFGVSTLHQLRGRVGRGDTQGVCYLLSGQKTEEAMARLTLMESESDGFKLSLMDLKQRGMGDILGERQSGLPHFILGDIETDQNILAQAKLDAKKIVEDKVLYKAIEKHIEMMYN